MAIAERRTSVIPLNFAGRSHSGWIILGYGALAAIALAAIYWASGGPGTTLADLATTAALP